MTPGSPIAGAGARSFRASVAALLCAGLLLGADGCVNKHSFRPEAFDTGAGDDIKVYMRERRMVEFDGGDYRAIDSAGVRYLTGNGIDNRPDSAVVKVPFSGYLPFSGIERIETSSVDVVAALYVIGFIGFFAVMGFTTNLAD